MVEDYTKGDWCRSCTLPASFASGACSRCGHGPEDRQSIASLERTASMTINLDIRVCTACGRWRVAGRKCAWCGARPTSSPTPSSVQPDDYAERSAAAERWGRRMFHFFVAVVLFGLIVVGARMLD